MSEPCDQPDRKLRILHVLRAPLGGLFRHVLDLTREQIARGHDVGLVVDSLTGGERAVEQLAALEPKLALGIKRMPMLRHPQIQDIVNVFKVEAYARSLKVDVLHGHGSKGGLYARLAGVLHRKGPMIRGYTPHGGSFNHVASPLVQAMYMRVEKLLATCTDVLLFESIYIANCFRERVGDTQALVRIVQNGISPAEFVPVAPNSNAADVLYVGELRSAKGIDTLIDAIAILSRRLGRSLKLICVGSGPDQADLEERARSRGISEHVTFPRRDGGSARHSRSDGSLLSRAAPSPYPTSCLKPPALRYLWSRRTSAASARSSVPIAIG